MSDKPRQYTNDEIREQFLQNVKTRISYCLNESRSETTKEKLELLAFCILSMIDGCAASSPGFKLIPSVHESDKDYHIENGENYYPYVDDHEYDIAGELHSMLFKEKE